MNTRPRESPSKQVGTPTRNAATRLNDLVTAGLIEADMIAELTPVVDRFQLRITDQLIDLMTTASAEDPIARQFVPDARELQISPHELVDPIGDDVHEPVRGITHRYPDRVLLKPTHLCQVYCRFCFRREKVGGGEHSLNDAEIDAALAYIAAHGEIFEVILTGGDPLVLSDRRLGRILEGLEAIDHVAVVRLHTRVVTADPARVTAGLVRLLQRRYAVWVGLHINHVDELTDASRDAVLCFVNGGIPLVSQTVLLKGVNDTTSALLDLMRALVRLKIKPYYLHHLDLAEGTQHFRVSIERGKALYQALRGQLSGLAQPIYVLDIPGGFGKVPIERDWIHRSGDGSYRVRDWRGHEHHYSDPGETGQ